MVAVFERDGRPGTSRMLDVAFGALTAGVAGAACGRVIATHAHRFDADDRALAAILALAAGKLDYSFRPTGEALSLRRCCGCTTSSPSEPPSFSEHG